jgi:hypothetical protein
VVQLAISRQRVRACCFLAIVQSVLLLGLVQGRAPNLPFDQGNKLWVSLSSTGRVTRVYFRVDGAHVTQLVGSLEAASSRSEAVMPFIQV